VTVFGIGIDVVEIARVADLIRSHDQRFLNRVLAKRLNIETVLVSLSHSQAYAVANALLLKSI
jgi:phosphopantetheinyl transferase (holo-ACP synthase)